MQFCSRPNRHLDSWLTMFPGTGRPTTQLCARLSRYLDSILIRCFWAWRLTMQLCTQPSCPLDREFTMCPWTFILPLPQSTEHSNRCLASACQVMRPPNLLSITRVCPQDQWPPGSLQTTSPPSQLNTGLKSHRNTSLTPNPLTGCLSTLQRSEHSIPFSPQIYFSLSSCGLLSLHYAFLGGFSEENDTMP